MYRLVRSGALVYPDPRLFGGLQSGPAINHEIESMNMKILFFIPKPLQHKGHNQLKVCSPDSS